MRGQKQPEKSPPPPILLIVCQNSVHAQIVYQWLAEDKPAFGVSRSMLRRLRNDKGQLKTLWAAPALLHETEGASDASRWLRFTLDTVGQAEWPSNQQGELIYPRGFEVLAKKLGKSLHPPGRDLSCLIVAGRLSEGWRLPITHLIGLRSFTSQLQSELVLGAALRRNSEHVDHQGEQELLKVVGIPFEVVPFKDSS